MSAFEKVMEAVRRLDAPVTGRDGKARTRCPVHNGTAPDSLAISIGRDKQVLLHCFNECPYAEIVAALGLTPADMFEQARSSDGKGSLVTSYAYRDESGVIRYWQDRFVPKTFRPRLPDGSRSLPKGLRILYRLPEIAEAVKAGDTIFVCEGEKDADNLVTKAGVAATTMPGGTGMGWQDSYTESLVGAGEVIVVCDRDDAGIKHAHKVADSLRRRAIPHRILMPAIGKDITDHLTAGLEFGDLLNLDGTPIAEAEEEPPPAEEEPAAEPAGLEDRFPRLDWHAAFATDFSQIDWLPGRFIERGQQVAIVGDGKVGKTLFVHDWLWRGATGRSFLGDERRAPLRILYFDRENGLRDIVTRMQAFGAKADDLESFDYRMFPKFSGGLDAAQIAVTELLAVVEQSAPDVVVFDTVSRFIAGKENDSDTWLQFYARVHAPLKSRGITGVRLDHMGKDTDKGSRGSSAKSQDVDHVWELNRVDEQHSNDGGLETIATQIKMKRTHTRTGLGDDYLDVTRRGRKGPNGMWLTGETRHELTDPTVVRQQSQLIQSYIDELMAKNVPRGLGRDKLRDWATAHGISLPGKTDTLRDIANGLKTAQGAF